MRKRYRTWLDARLFLPPLLFALLAGACARADGAAVTIEKHATKVQEIDFDPAAPPADMPELSPGEAAVTRATFGVASTVEVEVVADHRGADQTTSTVKITAARVRLTLDVKIWLPPDPSDDLVAHEQGHRRISDLFYKDAETTMRKLAARRIGQTIQGKGHNTDTARQAAMHNLIVAMNADYMATTQGPSARVNALFDKITEHGLNKKISVDDAIKQAMDQYRADQKKK